MSLICMSLQIIELLGSSKYDSSTEVYENVIYDKSKMWNQTQNDS